jgi:hypothetical protein
MRGEIAQRRVVKDKGKIVIICPEGEYNAAELEGREPEGAGFPRADVEIVPEKKGAHSEIPWNRADSSTGD